MVNKSHRSAVSTSVLIFMPYFKKKKKKKKKTDRKQFFFKHDPKKTVFFCITTHSNLVWLWFRREEDL